MSTFLLHSYIQFKNHVLYCVFPICLLRQMRKGSQVNENDPFRHDSGIPSKSSRLERGPSKFGVFEKKIWNGRSTWKSQIKLNVFREEGNFLIDDSVRRPHCPSTLQGSSSWNSIPVDEEEDTIRRTTMTLGWGSVRTTRTRPERRPSGDRVCWAIPRGPGVDDNLCDGDLNLRVKTSVPSQSGLCSEANTLELRFPVPL